jgi:phosphatidylglycerol:prolipoprotein diacylglycerol transferase
MECFGRYTDNPLAMALNVDKVNASMLTPDLLEKSFMAEGIKYIQVHPTFLYESLWSLMTLIVLLLFTKRKKFDGQIFLMYVIGYGSGRFWIEGLRTDSLMIGPLRQAQVLSLCLIAAGCVLWVILSRRKTQAVAKPGDPSEEAGQPEDGQE